MGSGRFQTARIQQSPQWAQRLSKESLQLGGGRRGLQSHPAEAPLFQPHAGSTGLAIAAGALGNRSSISQTGKRLIALRAARALLRSCWLIASQ